VALYKTLAVTFSNSELRSERTNGFHMALKLLFSWASYSIWQSRNQPTNQPTTRVRVLES